MSDKVTLPRTLTGLVVSDKMEQTIVVLVERRVRHPKYQKIVRRSTKIHAHNPDNTARQGDVVVVKDVDLFQELKHGCLKVLKKKQRQLRGTGDDTNRIAIAGR